MPVTVEQLYKGLMAHGAAAIAAAALTGNAVSETGPSTSDLSPDSELDPEYDLTGCIGLWCWEPEFFNPPRPTGDPIVDMNRDIVYMKATGGFRAAVGADAMAAGRNFALNYERCQECYLGGEQYMARGDQAAAVARLAEAGGWDTPPPPLKSMHYARYPAKWRPGIERTDVLKALGHPSAQQRVWLKGRTVQCRLRATFTIRKARRLGSRKHPDWNDYRGWIYQQLHLRGEGKRAEPTT